MTIENPSSAVPRTLPLRAILGLKRRADGELNELQALQMAPVAGKEQQRLGLHILVGAIAAFGMLVDAPQLQVAVWLGVLVSYSIWSYRRITWICTWGGPGSLDQQMRWVNTHIMGVGLIWASAYFLTGRIPSLDTVLALWAVSLLVMVATTILTSTLPMACIIFVTLTTVAAALAFGLLGQWVFMAVALVMGIMLSTISIRFAQSYLLFRMAEGTLHEKSETVSLLLREFEETSADWLWQTDSSRRLYHVTPRLAFALGGSADALEGTPLLQALSGDSWATGEFTPALHELAERMKQRESFANLVVPVTINGNKHWWELSASPRLDETGRFLGFRGVGSDVTEQRASAEKISKMARFDNLTGLPNRQQLNEALATALSEALQTKSRCALLMIDLDRFKAVNDTLGHPVGDMLLSRVGERLRALMPANALCGRLGGDEFAIVVSNIRQAVEVEELGNRIVATLSRPYDVDHHTLFVGASIGFAMGPRDGATVETLTRNADLALYKAKDHGGNVVRQYESSLHADAEERRVMEFELRGALERGEFELHYQPVVDANDGTLDGFEALLRWNSKKLGPVSPAKFIPVAEDARLIAPIGEWVLRTACHEAMKWPSNLKIAINVSAEQLTDTGFTTVVVSALAQSGLPARRLEIEVTESVFLRDGGNAADQLNQLIGLGVRLSLDDFGTGYSSLGYLRKTRFSTIKVDRSFVQGAARGTPESIAIIRAVVALADSLDMSTTAEGAETEQEVETIRSLGCRKIQGYYFGRPMASADVMRLFASANNHQKVA